MVSLVFTYINKSKEKNNQQNKHATLEKIETRQSFMITKSKYGVTVLIVLS